MCFEGMENEDFAAKKFVAPKASDEFINCTDDANICKKYDKKADCIRNSALSQRVNFKYCAVGGKKISPTATTTTK